MASHTSPDPYTGAVLGPGRVASLVARAGEAARVTHHQPPCHSDLIQWSSHRESTSPPHEMARGRMRPFRLTSPRASPAPSPTSPGALLPSLTLPWFELIPCGLASHAVGPGRNVSDMYIDVLKHSAVASSPLMHTSLRLSRRRFTCPSLRTSSPEAVSRTPISLQVKAAFPAPAALVSHFAAFRTIGRGRTLLFSMC